MLQRNSPSEGPLDASLSRIFSNRSKFSKQLAQHLRKVALPISLLILVPQSSPGQQVDCRGGDISDLAFPCEGDLDDSQLFPGDLGLPGPYYAGFMVALGAQPNSLHPGIDVEAPAGTNVMAPVKSTEDYGAIVATQDYVLLMAAEFANFVPIQGTESTQDGKAVRLFVGHLTNLMFQGLSVFPTTVLGKVSGGHVPPHVHLGFYRSRTAGDDPALQGEQRLVDPTQHAFQNASWLNDSVAPQLDNQDPDIDILVDKDIFGVVTWKVRAHDGSSGSSNNFHKGLRSVVVAVNGTALHDRSILFEKYQKRDGSYPPDVNEYYSSYPSGMSNNPNQLEFKLTWPDPAGGGPTPEWLICLYDHKCNQCCYDDEGSTVDWATELSWRQEGIDVVLSWDLSPAWPNDWKEVRLVRSSSPEGAGEIVWMEDVNPETETSTTWRDEGALGTAHEFWYHLEASRGGRVFYNLGTTHVYGVERLQAPTILWGPNPLREASMAVRVQGTDVTPRLTIFSVTGRIVREVWGPTGGGSANREITWDCRDQAGARVAPGVYLAKLEVAGERRMRKVTVLQ